MDPFQVVGTAVPRADAHAKVTGSALFIDDLRFPRMFYLKALRAGVPHGKIISIDLQDAEKIPGVIKVITGQTEGFDTTLLFGMCIFDQPPIAIDKVRHAGEVVAVVIAESEQIASMAIQAIKIQYEELPFVLDPIEAANPSAPLIHERNGEYFHLDTFVPEPNTNIFFKYHLKKGNSSDVFETADVVVEDNFEYPLMNHAAIEPHGAIAFWNQTGDLHLWSSTQAPFVLREVLHNMLKIPMQKIHIHVPDGGCGGGFGGKSDYTIEPLIAVAARFVPNYYVKWVLTREEVFIGTLLGRGMKGRMKLGATKDGKLIGIETEVYFSDGAYGDTSCNVVLATGHNSVGPYYFPNCNLKSFGIYTNSPPVGAYRGYGHPEGQFMVERLIEQLALKLGINSLELRKMNFLKPGDTNSLNQLITKHNGDIRKCFTKMLAALEVDPLPDEDDEYLYGRGVAALVKSPVQASNASSTVFLKFNEDLTVNISTGSVEIGQGSLTVLAQIAAERLKLPIDNIRINNEINSSLTPYEWQTVASMTTMRVGNAIIKACDKAINIMKKNAAQVFQCDSNSLSYDGKSVSNGNNEISLRDLVFGFIFPDGHTVGDPVLATGSSVVRDVTLPDPHSGQYQPYEWTFGSQGVDIRIDKKTGNIKVLHFVTSLDVGKVINPETAKGQVYGGVMQGLGAALKEKIQFDEKGLMRTKNLHRYKIPRISDMPEKYTCIFIENSQPDGPYGARPMAEHPIIGPPPAILNAIQNATNLSLTSIPVTPEIVLDILHKRETLLLKNITSSSSDTLDKVNERS